MVGSPANSSVLETDLSILYRDPGSPVFFVAAGSKFNCRPRPQSPKRPQRTAPASSRRRGLVVSVGVGYACAQWCMGQGGWGQARGSVEFAGRGGARAVAAWRGGPTLPWQRVPLAAPLGWPPPPPPGRVPLWPLPPTRRHRRLAGRGQGPRSCAAWCRVLPPGRARRGRRDASVTALLSWPSRVLSVTTLSVARSCWLPPRDRPRFTRPSCRLLLLCWLGRSCRRRSRLATRGRAMRLQFLLVATIVLGAAAAVMAAPSRGVAAGVSGPQPPHHHREVTVGLVGKRAMRRLQSMSRQVCINP